MHLTTVMNDYKHSKIMIVKYLLYARTNMK